MRGIGILAVAATLATVLGTNPMAATNKNPLETTALPRPDTVGKTTLEKTLKTRRSIREYGRGRLTLAELSQLLWAAQGITNPQGDRTAPSAGALFPLEIYVAAGRVEGLAPGIYRYRPRQHDLVKVAAEDRRTELANAALRQTWMRDGAVILAFAAVYERITGKYGERGIRYVHMETGHAAQNVYLQATALNLGTAFVGAFHDKRVGELLMLRDDERPLGLMPVGRR